MVELFLAPSVRSYLLGLPDHEQRWARRALSWLRRNPQRGVELWGVEGLFYLCLYGAVDLIYRARRGRVEVVALRCAPLSPPKEKIAAVVLAAGEDEVGGRPLPLLPVEGVPLISRVMDPFLSSGVDELVVVLGYRAEEVRRALEGREVKVVVNPDYRKGLSNSLRCGLKAVSPWASAVIISLGNLPFISPDTVRRLLSVYREGRRAIVAPVCGRRRGHPVLFDGSLIPELLRVRGDRGGRGVIKRHRRQLMEVEVEDPGIFLQIGSEAA